MNLLEFAQLLGNEDVREVLDFVGLDVLSTLEVKKLEVKKEEEREIKVEKKKIESRKKLSGGKGLSPRMSVTLTPENEDHIKKGASILNMSWSLYVNKLIDMDRKRVQKLKSKY